MKKLLLTLSAVALLIGISFAQNPIPKGARQINAGFGLGESSVPVYFGMDFGIGNDFSLGFETSYRDRADYYNVWGIAGNVNYHFNRVLNIPKNFDFYAGANVGTYFYSYYDRYDGDKMSALGLGLQVGGRYYFNSTIAVNLEVGGANAFSGGKLGLTFRF
jgi:hypothetical protein